MLNRLKRYMLLLALLFAFTAPQNAEAARTLYAYDFNPANTVASYFPGATVSGITIAAASSTAGSNGLTATSSTAGTISYTLASQLDFTQPGRVCIRIEYDNDLAGALTVALKSTTGTNSAYAGFNANVSTNGTYAWASTSTGLQSYSMTSGHRYDIWYAWTGDNGTVSSGVYDVDARDGLGGSISNPTFNAQNNSPGFRYLVETSAKNNNQGNGSTQAERYGTAGGNPLTVLSVSTTSTGATATRILGICITQNGLEGGSDPKFQFGGFVNTTVSGDPSGWILLSPRYDGTTSVDALHIFHPNAGNALTFIRNTEIDGGKFAMSANQTFNLFGIVGESVTGAGTGYTQATASNWGAPAGMAFRYAMEDRVYSLLPKTRSVVGIGASMGGQNMLQEMINQPSRMRGGILMTAVGSIYNSYVATGSASTGTSFQAIINTAYGTTGTNWTGTYGSIDAISQINKLINTDVLVIDGGLDQILPFSLQGKAITDAVNAAGGHWVYVLNPAAGHITDTSNPYTVRLLNTNAERMLRFIGEMVTPKQGRAGINGGAVGGRKQ